MAGGTRERLSRRRQRRPVARSSRRLQQHAFVQAAGVVFTVGTIDLKGPPNQAIDIAAGGTWVVVVALQIAYLPALYGAFNRRESLVAMLESRAGLPAWGPEVLARHPCHPTHTTRSESATCRSAASPSTSRYVRVTLM